jgi:hypothetical protein
MNNNKTFAVTFKPIGAKRRKTLLGKLERQGRGKDGITYYFFRRLNRDGSDYCLESNSTEYFLVGENNLTDMVPQDRSTQEEIA